MITILPLPVFFPTILLLWSYPMHPHVATVLDKKLPPSWRPNPAYGIAVYQAPTRCRSALNR
jgi:hypothetical protein